ncbi:hypothetical protein MPL1032_210055 [Mesorhizobium plurifarium]|uniref:Uncharacterized protein n=1 Tax=Mesorhizobium plurifarium TaxID=69974 RepID=A0A0K2VZA5_MESPL|nr:hypothetical protein MPL1032_210055 [Mesorhizobium plurifarium]
MQRRLRRAGGGLSFRADFPLRRHTRAVAAGAADPTATGKPWSHRPGQLTAAGTASGDHFPTISSTRLAMLRRSNEFTCVV